MSGQVRLSHDHHLWCDVPPVVSGDGFLPVTEVRLIASCCDGAGHRWQSQNSYLVSASTTFATDTTAAVGEDYYGVAAEGPLYSMRCQESSPQDFVLPHDGKLKLAFQLFDGGTEVWSAETVRTTHGEETDGGGFLWFLHNGEPGAAHGVSMLRARGFRVKDRAVRTDDPDLDPLLTEMREDDEPFHLVASGRSSEAALELAQRLPGLKSVVAFSGSGLRFSPWKIEGRELPHVVCDHSTLQPRGQTMLATRKIYAEAVADRENRDQGRIEVEKIACSLYLFTGSDDQIWPSAAFSELAAQRRKQHGLEETTIHRTFPSVGYDLGPALGLPGLPTTERTISHTSTGFRLLLGGKMGRQSRARRECWERLVEILKAH